MATATRDREPTRISPLAATDLVARFGEIPLRRIVFDPPPGTATEEDALAASSRTDRICELVDGVLLEKEMSAIASQIAAEIIFLLKLFLKDNPLGIILAPDALMLLMPGCIRAPDVSFVPFADLPNGRLPQDAIPHLKPALAVEVISPGNTKREMEDKLDDYFRAGVALVWYVFPETRTVHLYQNRDQAKVLNDTDTLTGGNVLPGFQVTVADFFPELQNVSPSPR